MKKRRKKKSPKAGLFVLFVLAGIAVAAVFLFRQELMDRLKPEKRSIPTEKRGLLLYFSDPESEYLIGEKREILKKGGVSEEAQEMIRELIRGPKGRLIPTIPPRTRLLSFQLDEKGVAKVNFNQALSRDHPGGSSAEMMTIYSIVNSLTLNFPQIKRVQILIEGKARKTIAGHLSLEKPISPNSDIVKKGKV